MEHHTKMNLTNRGKYDETLVVGSATISKRLFVHPRFKTRVRMEIPKPELQSELPEADGVNAEAFASQYFLI